MSKLIEVSLLAYNLKKIIEEKGLRQAWVAGKLGLTPQQLSNFLSGQSKLNNIMIELIRPICDVIDCEPNDLFMPISDENKDQAGF